MKTDVIRLLHEANPVTVEPPYDEAQLRARVDAITGTPVWPDAIDATALGLVDRRSPGSRPGWLVPVGAAASVAVLAAAGLTIAHEHRAARTGGGGSVITCRTAETASASSSTAARRVISDRLAATGGRAVSFRLDGRAITFRAHGVDARTAATACAATTAALRPLIAGPVLANATGAHSATPLAGLGFAPPRSASQLAGLSVSQRARLTTAMARFDCSPARSTNAAAAVLACGLSGGRRSVYLLSPTLVTSSGIDSATAHAPDQSIGQPEWSVLMSFAPAAQAAVAHYTQQHYAAPNSTTCSAQPASCANFLASVVDHRVASVSEIAAPLNGELETAGGFDQMSATALADDFSAASIGLTPAAR